VQVQEFIEWELKTELVGVHIQITTQCLVIVSPQEWQLQLPQ